MFYFEDSFNKSIILWKSAYYSNGDNIRDTLWDEFHRVDNAMFNNNECNDWDKCMPWAIYSVLTRRCSSCGVKVGEIIVSEFEEQFCANFTHDNYELDFKNEYMGFRDNNLSRLKTIEYLNQFDIHFLDMRDRKLKKNNN